MDCFLRILTGYYRRRRANLNLDFQFLAFIQKVQDASCDSASSAAERHGMSFRRRGTCLDDVFGFFGANTALQKESPELIHRFVFPTKSNLSLHI